MDYGAKAEAQEQLRQQEAEKAAEKAKEAEKKAPVPDSLAALGVETARQARVKEAEALAGGQEAQQSPTEQDPDVSPEAEVPTSDGTVAEVSGKEEQEAGFWGSVKAGFGAVTTWLTANFKKFGEWTSEKSTAFGVWFRKTFDLKEPEEKKNEGQQPTPLLVSASEYLQKLAVRSWEDLQGISDKSQRVVQAALFAYATGMDCFTKDGNHCSGWCDSVFEKAGLDLYDQSSRIYVGDYENWKPRGTLTGLELKPGDSIIRYNGNGETGFHQEIVLSSNGPDANGNYEAVTVGQTSVSGNSGERKIRPLSIKGRDIKVVTRPSA